MGTTGESSSVDATTVPALSPVEDAVGSAASVAAPLVLWGADQAAVTGAGAGCGLPVSVIAAGDVAVAVESTLATAFPTAPAPAAVPSLLGSASVAVVVEADVAQGSDVVVAGADAVVAVVVSAPFVVLPDEAAASVAGDAHDVFVAAVVVSVATPVSAVVVEVVGGDDASVVEADVAVGGDDASVVEADVAVGEDDASVVEADVAVDELELAVSDVAAVTSEGVTDTPTVVSAVGAPPVASAVVVVVSLAAEAAVVSVDCAVVSTVCAGGAGTSSALAGAIQADAETTATIRTAAAPIRRRIRPH